VRDLKKELNEDEEPVSNIRRPKNRSECRDGLRPCPWVGCKYHLYLDVREDTGSIKFNFPSLDPLDLKETCALDMADREGMTLGEVGTLLNLSRERIRQLESILLQKLKRLLLELNPETFPPTDPPEDQ